LTLGQQPLTERKIKMTGDPMSMNNLSSMSIQTSAEPIPSVPAWFGEVALIAHTLTRLGLLSEISERVRFARKRFGTFEVIDFVVVLMGYAISGEPTLAAYYERLQPFATAFMALFGRTQLPHRSTLSRFLAALDQASVEALSPRDAQRDAPLKRNGSKPSFVEFALSARGRNFHATISKQAI
jgi:hypothetical protein